LAGIYIHIPFCKRKCHYCNFFSVATTRWKEPFLKALLEEIAARQDYLEGEKVNTVYFGGGTPSLARIDEISLIIDQLTKHFDIDPLAEITLEANPDDITPDWLQELKHTAVNRLSIGVQSFFDDDLLYLNRVHGGKQALNAVKSAQDAGFGNLTIDLIYGIPTLTEAKWQQNLDTFFSLDIPHLSAYSLTVEKKTPLDLLIRKGKATPVDEEQAINHFKMLLEAARLHHFIHYEISNFSREGWYSKHNSLYWLGGNYLGLGPSAHSYNGRSRQWNVSSINGYINNSGRSSVEEKEELTLEQRYNEYVMTSLRTVWGCDSEHIGNAFGEKLEAYFTGNALKYMDNHHLFKDGSKYFLTDEGKLFADGIAASLFV
jgi:oxygen-independent coproporphyrinogen III oxidase